MTVLKRVLLIVTLLTIALVSAACGGGGGGGGAGSATDAAKAFIEATFKGDFTALRNSVCEAQRGNLTAEQEAQIKAGLEQMGGMGNLDISGITYTQDGNTVKLGGTIKVSIQGTSMDLPVDSMFAEGLPVVQEGGSWKVCPTNILGG